MTGMVIGTMGYFSAMSFPLVPVCMAASVGVYGAVKFQQQYIDSSAPPPPTITPPPITPHE